MNASPAPIQKRFRTFRTTASATPYAGLIPIRLAKAPRGHFIDANAEWNELEGDGNDAIQRLKHDRLGERGAPVSQQPAEREKVLEDRDGVEEQVEGKRTPQAGGMPG